MKDEQPTIWTSGGTRLQSELRHAPHWEDHPDATVFVDEWFDGETSVHRSVHVLSKRGVLGQAAAAGL